MQKRFFLVLFFLFFSLINVSSQTTIIEMHDLNKTTWIAPEGIQSDVNVVHDHNWLYNTKFRVELQFTPIKGHEYKVQHRIISYFTIVKSCFWYDTLQVIDLTLNEVIANKTKGFSSDCFGRPYFRQDFNDTTADFYWLEEIQLIKPTVELNADKTTGFMPLTVNFKGKCLANTKTAEIKKCEIDYGDGIKEEFNEQAHTFTREGIYNVKLKAIDSFDESSETEIKIEVKKLPKITSLNIENTKVLEDIKIEIECENTNIIDIAIKSVTGETIETKKIECNGKQTITLKPISIAGPYYLTASIPECKEACITEKQFIVFEEKKEENLETIAIIIFFFILIILGLLYHQKIRALKGKKEGKWPKKHKKT